MKHTAKRLMSAILCAVICASCALCLPVSAAEEAEDTAVPQIVVTTVNGNGCDLQKADGYTDAHIAITDVDGSVLEDDCTFKVRGNTTAMTTVKKKAFTFKFSKKKNVLGMGKGKKWALIANAFDPTLLRNYVAFNTAYELGLPYASNQQFVELWVDGSYRGCYTLYEPVQEGSDRVDIDIDSNDGKNDFLVELETLREEEDTVYFTAEGLRFIASEPDEPDEDQLAYIQSTMTDIIHTIKTGTREEIEAKIDMPSFVSFYLLNEYFKTYDFSISSVFFFYKDGILYAGPPWDYDLSMGNTNPKYPGRCTEVNSPEGIYANKNIYLFLVGRDWFKELVRDEYERHYDYFADLHTDGGQLDALRARCGALFDRNFDSSVWNIGRSWINLQRPAEKTYEANYAFLKEWLSERHDWFESYLEPFVREYLKGDTDGNGYIDSVDATLVQRVLLDLDDDPYDALRGHVTDSSEPTILDVTEIQRYIVSLPTDSSVGAVAKARFR